jgi:aldose 1-epimerase
MVFDALQGRDPNIVATEGRACLAALPLLATLAHPATGRVMQVYTSEPAVQTYFATHLDGSQLGKGGVLYQKHAGLCLETQRSANAENWPKDGGVGSSSRVVRPDAPYWQTTVWKFSGDGSSARGAGL